MDQKKKIIEIQHVSKCFGPSPSKTFALQDINLSIEQGEVYGIIGMSGAGKSTLLRCLTGLEKPSEGSIIIEGVDVARLTRKELNRLRKKIGMIFQHFHLFSSRTVAENIAYAMEIFGVPKKQQHERIKELLELVGLQNKWDVYPSKLSGGEKQRVGIARALANHPHLLLCDEPTSALDPKTTRSLLQLLQTLNEKLGITIVMITHQMEVVKQICTRLIVLSEGKVVEEGSMTELFVHSKHSMTKHLLHGEIEHLPAPLLRDRDPHKTLVRLCFEGGSAKEPLIAQMSKQFQVEASILLGNLDLIQNTIIGNLVVELSGSESEKERALKFLQSHHVNCEVLNDA